MNGNGMDAPTPGPQRVGLNCPQCKAFIETTMLQLITANALICPNCRLRLNIDRMKSRQAIEALRKVQAAQRNLEEKSKFNR